MRESPNPGKLLSAKVHTWVWEARQKISSHRGSLTFTKTNCRVTFTQTIITGATSSSGLTDPVYRPPAAATKRTDKHQELYYLGQLLYFLMRKKSWHGIAVRKMWLESTGLEDSRRNGTKGSWTNLESLLIWVLIAHRTQRASYIYIRANAVPRRMEQLAAA